MKQQHIVATLWVLDSGQVKVLSFSGVLYERELIVLPFFAVYSVGHSVSYVCVCENNVALA